MEASQPQHEGMVAGSTGDGVSGSGQDAPTLDLDALQQRLRQGFEVFESATELESHALASELLGELPRAASAPSLVCLPGARSGPEVAGMGGALQFLPAAVGLPPLPRARSAIMGPSAGTQQADPTRVLLPGVGVTIQPLPWQPGTSALLARHGSDGSACGSSGGHGGYDVLPMEDAVLDSVDVDHTELDLPPPPPPQVPAPQSHHPQHRGSKPSKKLSKAVSGTSLEDCLAYNT